LCAGLQCTMAGLLGSPDSNQTGVINQTWDHELPQFSVQLQKYVLPISSRLTSRH
jgi:hypothetical protein